MSALTLSRRTNVDHRLRARLGEFARARKRAEATRFAVVGFVVGAAPAALVGAAAQVFGLDHGVTTAAMLIVLGMSIAFVVGWLRPIADERLAFELDHLLGLDERVTTAVEIARGHPSLPTPSPTKGGGDSGGRSSLNAISRVRGRSASSTIHRESPFPPLWERGQGVRGALAEEQLTDAVAHLSAARPGAVYGIRVSRRWLGAVGVAAALAAAPWLIPWPTVFGGATPASAVTTANNVQAARLDALAQQVEQSDHSLDPAARAQLAAQLRQTADQLRRDGPNAQQSASDLQRAEQLASAAAPQTGEDASLTLARIADALNSQAATQGVTRALDQQNVSQAAASMDQLANGLSQMTPEQRQAVANALQAASSAAQASDTPAAQQLQHAAQAARNGDAAGMKQASQALQQLGAASQAQSDANQARSQLDASRQAINDAAQAGLPQLSTNPNGSSSTSSDTSSSTQSSASNSQSGNSQSDASQSGNGDSSSRQNGQQGSPGAANSQSGAANGGQGPGSSGSQSGGDNGSQGGSSYGTGSANHLGDPNDPTGLAQREVVVPNDPNAPITDVTQSSQTQVGATGEAKVDYVNVLPRYRQQALEGVDNGAVPSDLRNVVKGYFDSLAPK